MFNIFFQLGHIISKTFFVLLILATSLFLSSCSKDSPSNEEESVVAGGEPSQQGQENYTMTFNTDTEVDIPTQVVEAGGVAKEPSTALTKSNYKFGGWYRDSDFRVPFSFSQQINSDIVLYARWVRQFIVRFQNVENARESYPPFFIDSNSRIAIPQVPTSADSTFEAWFTDADYTTIYLFSNRVRADITLYAKWRAEEVVRYNVVFNTNTGITPSTESFPEGEEVTEPEEPSRQTTERTTQQTHRYKFGGWYEDNNTFENKYAFDEPIGGDLTLYAKWIKTYQVSFNTRYAPLVIEPVDVDSGSQVSPPTFDPNIRTNYIMQGWNIRSGLISVEEYDFASPVIANIELLANWQRVSSTVTFDLSGGTGANIPAFETVPLSTAVTKPSPDPTLSGHDFLGWYADVSTPLDTIYNFDALVRENITLTAKWVSSSLTLRTVRFNTHGGSSIAPQIVSSGSTLSVLSDPPTRYGYYFTGWYSDAGATNPFDVNTPITSDKELNAGWITMAEYVINTSNNVPEIMGLHPNIPATARVDLQILRVVGDREYTRINERAFKDNVQVVSLDLSESGITEIQNQAFFGCTNLRGTIDFPSSIQWIGDGAFYNCVGLTGDLDLSSTSITQINGGTFLGCSGFDGALTLPNTLMEIEFDAFSGCRKLSGNLIIPNRVTNIDKGAFQGCSGFTGTLVIPSSIMWLDFRCFAGMTGIEEFRFESPVPPKFNFNRRQIFGSVAKMPNLRIAVPDGSEDAYRDAFPDEFGYDDKIVTY